MVRYRERERGKTKTRSSWYPFLDCGTPMFVPLLGVIQKDQEHPEAVSRLTVLAENPVLGFDQKMETSSVKVRI